MIPHNEEDPVVYVAHPQEHDESSCEACRQGNDEAFEMQLSSQSSEVLAKKLVKAINALFYVHDQLWYDASEPDRGACGACDANLHPAAQGRHWIIGTHSRPCPAQFAHDALIELGCHPTEKKTI